MERKTRAPGVNTKELDGDGGAPIGERCFFAVTNVVFVKRDPVVPDKNFAAGVGVRGVYVVLQRRREEAGAVNGQPQEKQDDKRGPGALSDRTKHIPSEVLQTGITRRENAGECKRLVYHARSNGSAEAAHF